MRPGEDSQRTLIEIRVSIKLIAGAGREDRCGGALRFARSPYTIRAAKRRRRANILYSLLAMPLPRLSSTTSTLLAPDEPPPGEVFNAELLERPAVAPILLICDHAGRRVPKALGDLGIEATAFERHIAWDIGAADAARHLARTFGAPLILGTYSRLVLDLNRAVDDPSSIPEVSDGTPVPGNAGLAAEDRAARIEALHTPYHATIEDAVRRLSQGGAVPAVISVHTCTPVFKGFARPWQIGVLWNRDPRIAAPLIAALSERGDIVVGDNQPYSGRDGQGYSVKQHAERHGFPAVALEIRQDLVDTHHGAAHWAGIVAEALGPILADPGLRAVRHY
jgi:predicted N-formylglutamate amidohydrolase